MSGTITGSHTTGVTLTAGTYSNPVTNAGTFNLVGPGTAIFAANPWTVVNDGSIGLPAAIDDGGIYLFAGGAVTNAGSGVMSGGLAIVLAAGTVANQAGGLIDGYGGAVQANGRLGLQNAGTIRAEASAGNAVSAAGVADVTNTGTITSNRRSGLVLGAGGTVTNSASATIAGYLSGISAAGAPLTLSNAGHIVGTNGAAVSLSSGGAVTNEAQGTISSHFGIGISNTGASGFLLNKGLITAGAGGAVDFFAGGTVSNMSGGAIESYQENAVYIAGGTGSVTNAGLLFGATYAGVHLQDGGTVLNSAGGTIVSRGAFAVDVTGASGVVVNAGLITAANDGIYLSNGGTITNLAGGVISRAQGRGAATTIDTAGTLGGVFLPTGFANVLRVDPGAVLTGTIAGGNIVGSTVASTLELAAGAGTLGGVGGSVAQFGTIAFDSGAAWLLAGSTYGLAHREAITGFAPGDTIELTGTVASYSAFAGGVLTLSGGTTLDLPSAAHVNVTTAGLNTLITACFAEGTRVMTDRGYVAVETLAPGACVLTCSGRLAAVRWLGYRATNLTKHPTPHDVMPVRIRAGAFGADQPSRDLILSPDHAVFVNGNLIPVRYLINGTSIAQEARDAVTYWHVEMDHHDVILAEGLPCETYLDTGNRAAFENADGPAELHPDFARRVWVEDGCAPILLDAADPVLRALHTRLLIAARDHAGRAERALNAA